MNKFKIPSAVHLAVGTELTSGQITNRNSAWLSRELLDQFGIRSDLHLTVPDDRAAIRRALADLSVDHRLIFVTGGLGPTSDDFTREVIAEWAQAELIFHEPSYQKIVNRLSGFGLPILENQKQQCYFPQGAEILENREGTANAFYLPERSLFVLPGPPVELESVWKHEICPRLAEQQKNWMDQPHHPLHLFQCLGPGESFIADLTEKALGQNSIERGYRYHRPYIEVKIWVPPHHEGLRQVRTALAPYLVQEGPLDIDQRISQNWKEKYSVKSRLQLVDLTEGRLVADRFWKSDHLSKLLGEIHFQKPEKISPLHLEVKAAKDLTEWTFLSDPFRSVFSFNIQHPRRFPRETLIFIEKSLWQWNQLLSAD